MAQIAQGQNNIADPQTDTTYTTMLGTYYSDRFVGRKTSMGEIFRQNQFTAAHRSIPFGTYLLVTNPNNGLQVVVRVNDRCPVRGVLDMTKLAVHTLGIKGSRKVQVVTLDEKTGYALWAAQDTTSMTDEEYYAFKDRCKTKRITPYTNKKSSTSKPQKETHSSPKAPAKPPTKIQPPTERKISDTTSCITRKANEDPSAAKVETQNIPPNDTTDYSTLPSKDKRYDLELCTVYTLKAASKVIGRLPQEFQSKAVLTHTPNNKEIKIVLVMTDIRSRVVRIQSMLNDDFPESYIIIHKPVETN